MTSEVEELDDSPWRPGADVQFERRETLAFDRDGLDEPDGVDVAPAPRRHRRAALAVVVALTVGAALVMLDRQGLRGELGDGAVALDEPVRDIVIPAPDRAEVVFDERPSITTEPICSATRLPRSATDRWFVGLADAVAVEGSLAAGAGGVAALTVDDAGASRLRFHDADDGTERWSVSDGDLGRPAALIGVVGRVVLLAGETEDGDASVLNAYDVDTGLRVWTRVFGRSVASALDSASEVFVLSDDAEDRFGIVGVYDVDTGSIAASATGRFVSYRDGRLVTVVGGKVLATTGPAANGELLGLVVASDAPFVVLGDTVVAATPDRPGRLIVSRDVGAGSFSSEVIELDTELDVPDVGVVTSLLAVSDVSLLVTSNGMVFGVEMVDDRFETLWSVEGVPLAMTASEAGATVLVSREGGAVQILVDVATGREFLSAPTTFGGIDEGDLYGNGVVVAGGTGGRGWRRAVGLDGSELWELPGRGELVVGDGVVYEVSRRVGTGSLPARTVIGIRALGGDSLDGCPSGPDRSGSTS